MIDLVLLTVDVTPRGASEWLETFAWILMAIILGSMITILLMMRTQVYDEEQRAEISSITASEIKSRPTRIPVKRGYARSSLEEQLRSAWSAGKTEIERTTVRSALRDARAELARATPSVPPIYRKGVLEGIAIVILAVVVYLPIVRFSDIGALYGRLQTSLGGVHPGGSSIREAIRGGYHLLADVLPAIVGEAIAVVVLSLLLILWDQWIVVGLLILAVSIYMIDQYDRGRRFTRWHRVPYVALLVLGGLLLGTRSLWALSVASSEGRLLETLLVAVAIVLLIVSGSISILARIDSPAWEDLKAAVATVVRSMTLRGVIVSRGLPYATVLLVALIAMAWVPPPDGLAHRAYTVPLPTWSGARYFLMVGTFAISSGLVVRILGWVYAQIRYRAVNNGDLRAQGMREVHLVPYVVEDQDGDPIYVCRIDDAKLAHRDVDELLEDVLDVVDAMHDRGKIRELTFSDYYGDRIESGIVDEEIVRKSLRGEIKSDVRSSISRAGGRPPRLDRERLEEHLRSQYPRDAYQEVVNDLRHRGELYEIAGELIYYQ